MKRRPRHRRLMHWVLSLGSLITDPKAFLTIVWVMTIGIMFSLVLVVLLTRRIETGMTKIRTKDEKWSGILINSLFLGMISAFLGLVFANVSEGITGWIPVFVMLTSMILMAVCGCADETAQVEMAFGLCTANLHARWYGFRYSDHQPCQSACAVRRHENGL